MMGRALLVGTGFLYCVAGLVLLIAPGDVLARLGETGASAPMVTVTQLLGAAWLALGYGNWVGRGIFMGGIHGRAMIAGNLVHAMVGAFVVLRQALDGAGSPALWAALSFATGLTGCFAWLLRHPPERRG